MEIKPTITYVETHKFMELDELIKCNVTFIDHSKVFIKGKCMILIQIKIDSHKFIGDVYYVLTIKSNTLSLVQLLEKGYEIKMKDYTLTLRDTHGTMIAKVTIIKNVIFLLNIETKMYKCLKACVKDKTWF